ncbi:MAG TPA: hypothetical protein VGR26_05095 [Acidimicrobiales bacterium]|nr:hypothetical protein [Acidimicrobiales bacterium]
MGPVEPDNEVVGAGGLEQTGAQRPQVDIAHQQAVEDIAEVAPLAQPPHQPPSVPQRKHV